MKNRLSIVFTIAVYHSYFKNEVCDFISIQPEETTASLMQRYGFTGREVENRIIFYGNTDGTLQKRLAYITSVTGASAFSFTLATTRSSLFTVITDVPSDWVGEWLYDSSDNLNATGNNAMQLHAAPSANTDTGNIGRISIRFSDIAGYDQQQDAPQYTIRYEARTTQWNYYVINKTAGELSNPAVISRSGPAVFGAPENVVLYTGEKALLFSSGSHLLPLNNTPQQQFSLVDKGKPENQTPGRSGEKMLCRSLPYPNPLQIEKGQDANGALASPMYVYI